MEPFVITPTEVESVLKSLSLGKASGPDTVNNRILKELSVELSSPLADLFNQSLSTSIFPDAWKEAYVSPIFKNGDRSAPGNYRPISLLSTIGKVFERLVFKHTFNYLNSNNILTSLQSGFVPGDSTVNQLVYLYNAFTEAIDSGKEVRAIFCDISKAFDRVWHAGLIHKLKCIGIRGGLLRWFSSYLSGRKQKVVIPGAQSNWNYIQAGVPQGSILGPLLFLIFINDIVVDINANIRLFADDTSLYLIIDDPATAAVTLNSDLLKISNWTRRWLVTFNPKKTESLIFSRKVTSRQHPSVHMSNEEIKEVSSHKHLGLILSNNLKWHDQIEYTLEKAYKLINIMRKLKFILDR